MKFALYANVAMSPCDMIERLTLEADNNLLSSQITLRW